MLIAKMAMWNKQWETARDAILELEKIYGDLSQYDYADVMFRNKNTPESIFEIQHTYSVTGLKYTSSIAAICMPKRDKDDIYDGLRIPELGDDLDLFAPEYLLFRIASAKRRNRHPYQIQSGVGIRRSAVQFDRRGRGASLDGTEILVSRDGEHRRP